MTHTQLTQKPVSKIATILFKKARQIEENKITVPSGDLIIFTTFVFNHRRFTVIMRNETLESITFGGGQMRISQQNN